MLGIVHPLDDIIVMLISSAGFISSIAFVWYLWKRGKFNLDQETISAYQNNSTALEGRLNTLAKDNEELRSEVKELTARLNKLIGRNEVLEETLALRDPKLMATLTQGLQAVIEMNKGFIEHNKMACDTNAKVNELVNKTK